MHVAMSPRLRTCTVQFELHVHSTEVLMIDERFGLRFRFRFV
jgi:hypothetical protein